MPWKILITNNKHDWTRQSMMADNTIHERTFLGLDILQRAINILRVPAVLLSFMVGFEVWGNKKVKCFIHS